MTTRPVVEIEDLSFSYGEVPVLEHVSLTIGKEEFFGIIGPNASGKSTLLRLMLGLMEPDRGSVRLLDTSPRQARTRVGYVPQHPGYRREFPVSVRDVVLMGRLGVTAPLGRYSSLDRAKAREAMQAVQVDDIADRNIAGLSGGQAQRMLIARALACEPEILILDEPTSNIDLRAEESIFALLKQYNARMTIIIVSHDVAFISAYVNRVGCLNRTLVCHATGDISGKTIEELYGTDVKMIQHRH
ncbi:MAG: ABC transporter ATP-binding protein [Gammaproteobacteria bacterium]|jgi:zinc transport system ATP-binding protein